MHSTERTCPQCLRTIVIETTVAGDDKQEAACPYCGIGIKFETRTTFATNAPLPGGRVVGIRPARASSSPADTP